MNMQGSRQLPVSTQQAWEALNDPAILKQCIPGCERFESTGADSYAVGVQIRIGPVSARFNGKVTLSDVHPPTGYTLKFDAQGGAAGFGKGESQVELIASETGCELRYTVGSQVGGKLAQLGSRLIDGAAKSLADDFFKRFEAALAQRFPPASAPAAPAAAQAEGSSDTAASAPASGPTVSRPVWLWALVAAAAAAVLWAVAS